MGYPENSMLFPTCKILNELVNLTILFCVTTIPRTFILLFISLLKEIKQNMVLAAWSLGVGSCWIGAINEEKIKQLLKMPEKWKVVALVTFGYPAEQPKPKKRR
jgi:nitroreductase